MPVPYSKQEQYILLRSKELECYQQNDTSLTQGGCPLIWDGILCWPNTPPDTLASLPCPAYFAGFNIQGNATKYCLSNGTWFFDYTYNQTWTNFSECVVHDTPRFNIALFEKYIPILRIMSQVGYGVSLVTLIFAFILLASFKRLRCPRNVLHMHLFVSFIMRAFLKLLKDSLFVRGIGLSQDFEAVLARGDLAGATSNSWLCKMITSLWQYFIMANYSWILMEGLYLHNLIFLALFSDTSAITVYVLLGWGLPIVFVVPWVAVRALFENTLCWTVNDNEYFFSIIRIPIALSILLNFGLFLNIVRVLLLKLTASISEEKRRYRRWAKSTLVLVPLFGVHYALFLGMSYSINKNVYVELVWLFCDQLFASFQGSFVAVLYCFMNGEVRSELAKLSWNKRSPQYFHNQYSISERPISRFFRSAKRYKRGSNAESCMTSFMSSVPTDLNNRRPTIQKNNINNSNLINEIKADSCLLNKGTTICANVPE